MLTLVLVNSLVVHACTIFLANDGQNVWIGNNEDELQQLKYRAWYYPAEKNNYGYAIWTDLSFGKLLNGFAYLNPQGGLNEYGLFMDYTAIDPVSVERDGQKKDRKKQVVTDILKKCKTVEEALSFLNKYNLIKLTSAQLFIGDASGNYATVTGAYVVRKTENNFALTNYCINNGHQEACYRRDAAIHYLQTAQTFDLEAVKNILEKTTQKPPNDVVSNYSMAVNLKTRTIYLYYKNDFTNVAVISLADELKKKKHHKDIVSYFPESIVPVLENELNSNGIDGVISTYTRLRKNSASQFNFTNDDAIDLAISWLEKGLTKESIRLLECLKEFDPQRTAIFSWLGVAYRKEGNGEESNKNFSVALERNPDDYVATLFGKQENQKVIFKLPDFEGAEQVALMGDFTGWTKNPVQMKKVNGYWSCEVSLPKGEVLYKFIVNKQYLADNKNFMHIGKGPDIFSKLYVW